MAALQHTIGSLIEFNVNPNEMDAREIEFHPKVRSIERSSRHHFFSLTESYKMAKSKIKSSLYLHNTLSDVTSGWCPIPWLCAGPTHQGVAAVASRWQRMEDLIGSELNRIPPAPETDVLLPCIMK